MFLEDLSEICDSGNKSAIVMRCIFLSLGARDINLHNPRCSAHAILHLIEARISLPRASTKFHIPSTRLVTRFPWSALRSREIFLLSDNESSCRLYPSVTHVSTRSDDYILVDANRQTMRVECVCPL